MTDVVLDREHASEANALLPTQYRSKANVAGFLAALMSEVQAVEQGLFSLWMGLLLKNAVGAALDQWGKLLNAPREGWTDAEYRVVLGTRIACYRSHGRTKDVLAVARIALGDENLEYHESTTSGHFVVQKDGIDPALVQAAAQALHDARAVGVGGLLVYSTEGPTNTLHWGGYGMTLATSGKEIRWGGAPYAPLSVIPSRWAGAQKVG